MHCPVCQSRHCTTGNGCQSCGYYTTPKQIQAEEDKLLAIVRANRNRSKAAVEWGGIEFPREVNQ